MRTILLRIGFFTRVPRKAKKRIKRLYERMFLPPGVRIVITVTKPDALEGSGTP